MKILIGILALFLMLWAWDKEKQATIKEIADELEKRQKEDDK